jgi:glycosyltransferase involved in cell wall biosynthesis
MKDIAFFVRHFTERGTENAIYDYAKYNEEILGNKSYIICFNETTQRLLGWPETRISYPKFKARFEVIEISSFKDMPFIIDKYRLDFFYTLTHGDYENIYMFENSEIWTGGATKSVCKTIKHCVFCTDGMQGDFYISISNHLNTLYNTNIPVIPHIVNSTPECNNLLSILNIPQDSIVLGRHGGNDTFDIPFVHSAIKQILNNGPENLYFLFMNTQAFFEHPRIIYLNATIDINEKNMFINSCDAMIHARQQGETFGLSIAEFSVLNKPIITYANSREKEHIEILGEKAILYKSETELMDIFININRHLNSRKEWNAYRNYSPDKVMELFDNMIFSLDKYKIENV